MDGGVTETACATRLKLRHQKRNNPPAVAAVNRKIMVNRHDATAIVQFGHANQAGVGERGGTVTIFRLNGGDCVRFFSQSDADSQHTAVDQWRNQGNLSRIDGAAVPRLQPQPRSAILRARFQSGPA